MCWESAWQLCVIMSIPAEEMDTGVFVNRFFVKVQSLSLFFTTSSLLY